ncbi:GAF domain-containing protein [Synechococcus sp. 'PEA 65AY6A-5F PE A']|uniref:sensor histidine kinase n=1 Tax=Synechococcus sp. 'PEA 65AY6A-5F PE A' TaxID=1504259 RepID=UPI0039C45A1D
MASTRYRLVPVGPGDSGFYPKHLYLALEATQLGYWQLDLRSGELSSSPQCKAKYGRDPGEEFTLEMFFERVHPEDRPRVKEALQSAGRRATEGDPNFAVEYRACLANGQVRWYLSQGIVLLGPEGDPGEIVGVTLDISERKQLEITLAERERHYRQLLEALPDMLLRLDRQGRCLEFKPPSHFSVPHPPAYYLGKTPEELFPEVACAGAAEPTAQAIREHLELALATRQAQEIEYPCPEGSPQPQYRQARIVPFGEDQVLMIIRNITPRKQAELKLQRQLQRERLFSQLIQAINASLDLPTLFDVAVREVRAVLQAARVTLYQYLPAEAVWLGVASYVQSPDLPTALHLHIPDSPDIVAIQYLKQLQVFHAPDPEQVLDPFAIYEKREYHLGPWLVIPVACQGKVWGALSLRRLTSDPDWQTDEIELAKAIGDHLAVAIQRSELYQKLQQTNAELDYQVRVRNAELEQAYNDEALLQLITEEIRSTLDEQKILETVARELALSLNLSNCAIALYDPERQVSVLAVDYLAGEGIRRFPLEVSFADFAHVLRQLRRGQLCHFSNLHHPFWPNHDRYTLIIAPICDKRDLTAQHEELLVLGDICGSRPPGQIFTEREQQLIQRVAGQCAIAIRQARLYQTIQRQVQQLQELNQLKDEFLHMVSHEMRTPLTNMKLAIGLLSKANLTERERRYFQILEMQTNRELELINDLLELQALQSGNKVLRLTCLSPQEWIPNLCEPFRLRAAQQGQQFQVEWDPDLLPLCTDESLLSRVVGELLNNACKYTPAGESICLRFSQSHQQGRPGWLIEVGNTGVEIPPEALPRLFEKFYRIPQLDRRKAGGTGLGLALAKKAMEILEGSLTVASHSGQVIFRVWCPSQRRTPQAGIPGEST